MMAFKSIFPELIIESKTGITLISLPVSIAIPRWEKSRIFGVNILGRMCRVNHHGFLCGVIRYHIGIIVALASPYRPIPLLSVKNECYKLESFLQDSIISEVAHIHMGIDSTCILRLNVYLGVLRDGFAYLKSNGLPSMT